MNELPFAQLLERLDRKASAERRPVQAMIELTYGCNLRCVHCYNPTHEAKGELPTEAVVRILNELAEEGCLRVGFTGGELFCRRDAFEVLDHAKRLGMIINILTNATMITEAVAGRLQTLDPYQIDVSVYGATAQTYESVTRIPGSFARFLGGLDLLVEHRLPILLKLVLLTPNVHEREAMRELAQCRHLRYQMATDVHPRVDGSMEPLTFRLSPEQAFEVWRDSVSDRQPSGIESSPPDSECRSDAREETCRFDGQVFHCRCGRTNAAVTPYGKLNLCLSIYHPQYDILHGSLGEGWRQLVGIVSSTKPGPTFECPQCTLLDQCSRGVGDSWLTTGQFDGACIAYYREIAEHKLDFIRNPTRPKGSQPLPRVENPGGV